MTKSLGRFLRDESGATAVEYGLLIALLCIGSVGIIGLLGDTVLSMYTMIVDYVVDASPGP